MGTNLWTKFGQCCVDDWRMTVIKHCLFRGSGRFHRFILVEHVHVLNILALILVKISQSLGMLVLHSNNH